MLLSLQDGETALMKASESGQMNCVRVLLDKGADVNIPNNVSAFWDNQLWHVHPYGVGNMMVTKLNYAHDTCLVPLLPASSNKHLCIWSGEEAQHIN